MIIGGVLGTLGERVEEVRYLATRRMVMIMNLYDAFLLRLLAGRTAC